MENSKSIKMVTKELNQSIEKQKSQVNNFYIKKIIYPEIPEIKYKKCQHFGNYILNRNILTPNQHLKLLSFPNKKVIPKPLKYTKIVERNIFPSSPRLAELAQPTKCRVLSNWKSHSNVLKPKKIENFWNLLENSNLTSIEEALKLFQHQKLEDKRIVLKQRSKINKLKKQEQKRKKELLKIILNKIYEEMKGFLLSEEKSETDEYILNLRDKYLTMICGLMKYKIPIKTSEHFADHFLLDLCEKLALWTDQFIINSGYINSNKEEQFEIKEDGIIIPIDHYIKYSSDSLNK